MDRIQNGAEIPLTTNPSRTRGMVLRARWLYGVLLAAIAIISIAGIVSAAAMGQTQVALAIGIIALAFFSRAGC